MVPAGSARKDTTASPSFPSGNQSLIIDTSRISHRIFKTVKGRSSMEIHFCRFVSVMSVKVEQAVGSSHQKNSPTKICKSITQRTIKCHSPVVTPGQTEETVGELQRSVCAAVPPSFSLVLRLKRELRGKPHVKARTCIYNIFVLPRCINQCKPGMLGCRDVAPPLRRDPRIVTASREP